ncbi:hypothetical protein [Acinetobacter soli]|uniref:hypothetical protein n=1 Tax=Acinetobacter soli TaxID=487316 RepID=UPI0032B35992
MRIYLKNNNEAYESFMDYIKQIFQHAQSYGSKSSILSILLWIIFGVIGPMILASIFAPQWVAILLAVILVSFLVLFAYTYLRCLHTGDTDSLRSEKFVISKMAIAKQSSSDSETGVQKLPEKIPRLSNVVESVQDDANEA